MPSSPTSPTKSARHLATVYDAVAGSVSSQRFIPNKPYIPATRDTADTSSVPLPPEEVLFRSQAAPQRYEDDDIYWADRNLKARQQLPESELLKLLHTYAAEFYERTFGEEADCSYESLDETALIALGILLEESCKDALGDTGDLALVEGEEASGSASDTISDGQDQEINDSSSEVISDTEEEKAIPDVEDDADVTADSEPTEDEPELPIPSRKKRKIV